MAAREVCRSPRWDPKACRASWRSRSRHSSTSPPCIQIALQKIDAMDAAPAAAGDVNAVGTLFAFEIGRARQIVFGIGCRRISVLRSIPSALLCMTVNQLVVDELPKRRRHREGPQLQGAHCFAFRGSTCK